MSEGEALGEITQVSGGMESCLWIFNYVPQVSNCLGSYKRKDDIIILLTLKPVHSCHLSGRWKVLILYYLFIIMLVII